MIVLRIKKGDSVIDVHQFTFAKTNFKGCQIVSGEKYYIDKAVSLGAVKQKRKKKAAE